MSTARIGTSRLVRVGDGSTVGVTVAAPPHGGRLGTSRMLRVWGAGAGGGGASQSVQWLDRVIGIESGSVGADPWVPFWRGPLGWDPDTTPRLFTVPPVGALPPNSLTITDQTGVGAYPTATVSASIVANGQTIGWDTTCQMTRNGTVVASEFWSFAPGFSTPDHTFVLTWAGTVAAGDVFQLQFSPGPLVDYQNMYWGYTKFTVSY